MAGVGSLRHAVLVRVGRSCSTRPAWPSITLCEPATETEALHLGFPAPERFPPLGATVVPKDRRQARQIVATLLRDVLLQHRIVHPHVVQYLVTALEKRPAWLIRLAGYDPVLLAGHSPLGPPPLRRRETAESPTNDPDRGSPLHTLGLSLRVFNLLSAEGVATVEYLGWLVDLARRNDPRCPFASMRGFGATSLEECCTRIDAWRAG